MWDVTTQINFAAIGHADPVFSVAFSHDDTTLASGTVAGTVELWDASGLMRDRLEALTEIYIPDTNLRARIAAAIGLPPSASIFRWHRNKFTRIRASNANISDLTGIEFAANLKDLDLRSNNISDISAVEGLTDVRDLDLALAGNNISDISAVEGLTNLKSLTLGRNNISDISALKGLTNLTSLYLRNNNISDISAVVGLTNLATLSLRSNNISDISPLVTNTGLGEGDTVYVWRNPLSYPSIQTHIPTLEACGVKVLFDVRTPTDFAPISGTNRAVCPARRFRIRLSSK